VTVVPSDPPNAASTVTGPFTYQYPGSGVVSTGTLSPSAGGLTGSFPSTELAPAEGGPIPVVITIRDAAGNTAVSRQSVRLDACSIIF
jgi:hypothetical protein